MIFFYWVVVKGNKVFIMYFVEVGVSFDVKEEVGKIFRDMVEELRGLVLF